MILTEFLPSPMGHGFVAGELEGELLALGIGSDTTWFVPVRYVFSFLVREVVGGFEKTAFISEIS